MNHFLFVNDTDGRGTLQVWTDTTQGKIGTTVVLNSSIRVILGPSQFINVSSCFWRRRLPNNDYVWGRQSNGTCTPTYENEIDPLGTVYTRNNRHCQLYNDEGSFELLTNTSFQSELHEFDKLLINEQRRAIVFVGSSSIRLWLTLSEDFINVPNGVINRGFGGSSLAECLHQYKRTVLPLEPSALIVYAGENDIAANVDISVVFSYFQQFISTVRRFDASLPIAYISIKPSPSRLDKLVNMNETNYLIREYIQSLSNVHYIDVFSRMLTPDNKPRSELFTVDNLHMNAQGYAIWTSLVQDFLKTKGLTSSAPKQYDSRALLWITFIFFSLSTSI